MLRGIDTKNARRDDAVMVKVADRVDIAGDITVYLREDPPEYARSRQQSVRDVFDALTAAGVLADVSIIEGPETVAHPSDTAVGEAYGEFVEAVGQRSLEPFFERKSATGDAEYIVELPPICIALRTDGALRGLYPYWEDGTHHSVEDCTTALSAGEAIANLA